MGMSRKFGGLISYMSGKKSTFNYTNFIRVSRVFNLTQ
jgi:hypothetical protein